MTPSKLRARTIVDRIGVVRKMLDDLRAVPLGSLDEFTSGPLNAPAAESYLRRALEALMDLGRHILAKGFGRGVAEYKKVGAELGEVGVLGAEETRLFQTMAGYRNRMVHFYDEISDRELYQICTHQLGDVERVLDAILAWLRSHPDRVEGTLE